MNAFSRVRKGFTVVELVVIIVVIAILAAIVTVSYRTVQRDTTKNSIQSDLLAYKSAMESRFSKDNEFPVGGVTFGSSNQIAITYKNGDADNYCIEGTSTRYPDIVFHVDTREGGLVKEGTCSAIIGVPAISSIAVVGGQATVNWGVVASATSYDVQYRMNGGAWNVSTAATPTKVYTGLALSATFDFQVRAKNASQTSSWSQTITRVTLPTPVIVSTGSPYCGNDSGLRAWADTTLGVQAASGVYTKSYLFVGDNGSTYGNTPKTVTNTGSGTISTVTSSTTWRPQDSDGGVFSVIGVGPNGERSATISWAEPIRPPYDC